MSLNLTSTGEHEAFASQIQTVAPALPNRSVEELAGLLDRARARLTHQIGAPLVEEELYPRVTSIPISIGSGAGDAAEPPLSVTPGRELSFARSGAWHRIVRGLRGRPNIDVGPDE